MWWLFLGLAAVALAAFMWLLVYASDRRRWDAEYRKAEDDKQAKILAEMMKNTTKMKCL